MIRFRFLALTSLLLAASACPVADDRGGSDPDFPADDDDDATDDDDAVGDDDDAVGDDDDAVGDDDDAVGDDDDDVGDDDDAVGDDDDAPVGPCTDDSAEDNDDLAGAGVGTAGLTENLVACPEDEDWYSMFVPAGKKLQVDTWFLDDDGDIDVYIRTAADESAGPAGTSTSDDENVVSDTVETDQDLYVRVILYGDAGATVGNEYDLELAVIDPPTCTPDPFEENDTDAAAVAITAGSHASLNVCTDDEDYYSISLNVGQTLQVNPTFVDAEGDIDAYVIDPAGAQVASGVSTSDDEDFTWTATTAGVHLVRVKLFADAGSVFGNTYGLNLTVQ